jgi:adenosine kinase
MIVGVENPLLDITVNVGEDDSLLRNYKLEPNTAILAGPEHLPLYEDLKKFSGVFYSAGGASQNAMRTAQWMLGDNHGQVIYMGCVGDDDSMHKMKHSVEVESGVRAVYQIDINQPTGTCGVIVSSHGKNRSLVANLGAANHFKVSHLQNHQTDVLDKASLIYSSGFFITSSTESVDYISNYVATSERRPLFAFNIAAPFLCEVEPFRLVLMRTITYVDYLFGNDSEAIALAKALGWTDIDIAAIAQRLANLEKKGISADLKRIVILTRGAQDTIVATQGKSQVDHFPIINVNEDDIVDSNGCGDAYAGAFVAGLVQGKSIEKCCQAGAYAANVIIKQSGVVFPHKSNFKW